MKKNVKVLGAAAAALLAVAPVVASATTVNASSVSVNSVTNNTTQTENPALNINVSLDANAGSTTAGQAARSVAMSIDNGGHVVGFDRANVRILEGDSALADSTKLQAGVQYKVEVKNVTFSNLLTGTTWNLGDATYAGDPQQTSQVLANGSNKNATFISAPFYLTEAGNTTQPYFTDSTGLQLANGAVANTGTDGEGVPTIIDATTSSATTDITAANILASAKKAVTLHNTANGNQDITTTASDVARQLAQQNVAVHNHVYTIPTGGFHVTLTGINRSSNRTVTVEVPFQGSAADYSSYPIIAFYGNLATDGTFTSNFSNSRAQGRQTPNASELVRTILVGSTFSNENALRPFQAWTHDSTSNIDLSVLNNPVNTRVPGRYTVTLQATDWSNNRTTRYSYTVQVGKAGATYQTVNYPAAYGINVWSLAGNTVSFTGHRVAGQSSVQTFDTRTVNGTSYTRIGKADSNTWVPTSFLGNHSSNTNKPSNNNGEKAISGVARVTYNGKGAVKLLNADGRHVDQYVQKGSSWKVWAEKTVNGVHMYRIGNQSQWVPAMYVTLN